MPLTSHPVAVGFIAIALGEFSTDDAAISQCDSTRALPVGIVSLLTNGEYNAQFLSLCNPALVAQGF
ncbi:hypothetical protein [Leptolyngbya sp. ST-U4]|uniref:hypothetical protein n=1 Tax=Leptolyngbya sp. ST-U4 TaxID=2933912 RepID=UPI0032970DE5